MPRLFRSELALGLALTQVPELTVILGRAPEKPHVMPTRSVRFCTLARLNVIRCELFTPMN